MTIGGKMIIFRYFLLSKGVFKKSIWGGPSRWQRSKKISDVQKGKNIPMYLGRAKEKRKNRDKRIVTGPAPLGGSCEGGKVSTH